METDHRDEEIFEIYLRSCLAQRRAIRILSRSLVVGPSAEPAPAEGPDRSGESGELALAP